MIRRLTGVALTAGLLAPVTGAALLLAIAYIRFGTTVSQDVFALYFRLLVVTLVIFGTLPAALVAGIGFSTPVTLRARGLSPRTLQPLGAALGALCGPLVASALLGFARPPKPWALGAALNGAMWDCSSPITL